MNSEEIKKMQSKIGVFADGFWGPKSQKACRDYLKSLMPQKNPWPNSDQISLRKFYGQPGDESNLITVDFPFATLYEGKQVKKFRCHKKVADSLIRVLKAIGEKYGKNREIMEEAEDFGGVYNFRNKRGGSTYSVHAWGAAIDLDADDNTFRDSWPMKADMPLEIMEEFSKEGWLSAGAFWNYDAMHFQATR
jgi:hypothetical protein